MKLLPDSLIAALKRRGLLRWRDVQAATAAIKKAGGIDVGAGREIPNGVWLDPDTTTSAADAEWPLSVHPAGINRVRITPSIVRGGTGWLVPSVDSYLIFDPSIPTLAASPYIYLVIEAEPLLAEDGDTYRAPVGTRLLTARIVGSDELLADVEAEALVSHVGPNDSIALLTAGTYHILLGTRDGDGNYPDSGFQGQLYCGFVANTFGSVRDHPTFRLASTWF